jgi:L-asparaginase II
MGSAAPAAGVAVKIEDGDAARRAGAVATCETLRQIGFLGEVELSQLAAYTATPIRDLPRGEVVGEVRAAFTLAR